MDSTEHEVSRPARWLGIPARPLILVGLAVYAVWTLAFRALNPAPPGDQYSRVVGRLYSDLVFHLGAPERIEPLAGGELALHYDEVQVQDGVFVRSHFTILIDRYSRAYAFERD